MQTVVVRQLLPFVKYLGTASMRRKFLRYLPLPASKEMADVIDALNSKAENIVENRAAALSGKAEDISQGKDILSILSTSHYSGHSQRSEVEILSECK